MYIHGIFHIVSDITHRSVSELGQILQSWGWYQGRYGKFHVIIYDLIKLKYWAKLAWTVHIKYLLILISIFFFIINLCFPSCGRDFCILHKNMYIIVANVMRNHSPTYLFWNW
jgi:hypothetical protein